MIFGARTLRQGDVGADVVELQLRLAGFAGTVWDGDFGPRTSNQVRTFQQDFMQETNPSGIADQSVFTALDRFAAEFPISFDDEPIKCPNCAGADGEFCTREGFGQMRYRTLYLHGRDEDDLRWDRTNRPDQNPSNTERRHQYEYPGIHKALFHTYRAFQFYAPLNNLDHPIRITSGYRCHINNVEKGRLSSNHMGKAMDFTFSGIQGDELETACNAGRDMLIAKSNCQLRWDSSNQKALEPGIQERVGEFVAKTWIHLDVREYLPARYLKAEFFIQSADALDDKDLG